MRLSLCLCRRLLEKGIKDKSKLLSACLSLSPRRICEDLSVFGFARGVSSKCRGSAPVCDPAAASASCDGLEAPVESFCLLAWRQTHRAVTPQRGADRSHDVVTLAEDPVIILYSEGCL